MPSLLMQCVAVFADGTPLHTVTVVMKRWSRHYGHEACANLPAVKMVLVQPAMAWLGWDSRGGKVVLEVCSHLLKVTGRSSLHSVQRRHCKQSGQVRRWTQRVEAAGLKSSSRVAEKVTGCCR